MLVRARFTGATGITLEVPVDVSGAVAEAEVLAAAVRKCKDEGLDGFATDAFTESEVLW